MGRIRPKKGKRRGLQVEAHQGVCVDVGLAWVEDRGRGRKEAGEEEPRGDQAFTPRRWGHRTALSRRETGLGLGFKSRVTALLLCTGGRRPNQGFPEAALETFGRVY